MSDANNESFGCLGAIGVVSGGILAIGTVVILSQFDNHRVPSGFAGYVNTVPVFGQNTFDKVLVGPSSTGFVWRRACTKVSITPYTIMETFDKGNGAVLGADKLPIECKAALVYRIDATKIKQFMEDFGGIAQTMGKNDDDVADEIMKFAYENFIQQPFRTAVRAELSKYEALDASSNLALISENVLKELNKRLENTPFLADSVAVGETNPPQQLIESVVKKVQANQENERKAIELEIARKQIDIERAAGEAEGAKKLEIARQEAAAQIARGEADAEVVRLQGKAAADATLMAAEAEAQGLKLKESALGARTLQWHQYTSMYNNAKMYLPTTEGSGSPFGVLGIMNMEQSTEQK